MQTITQILEHLQILPQDFKQHFLEGKYAWACMDYEHAVLVSKFIGLDVEARGKLLAEFDERTVRAAYRKAGRWKDEDRAGNAKNAV